MVCQEVTVTPNQQKRGRVFTIHGIGKRPSTGHTPNYSFLRCKLNSNVESQREKEPLPNQSVWYTAKIEYTALVMEYTALVKEYSTGKTLP